MDVIDTFRKKPTVRYAISIALLDLLHIASIPKLTDIKEGMWEKD